MTSLHSFASTDGANPNGLVQAANGDFYGTTTYGGSGGFGTIFKITPTGTLTSLHSFVGTDGAYSNAGLVQATDGDFYGTTSSGGANGNDIGGAQGWGTIFSLSTGLGQSVETLPTSGKVGAASMILGTDLTGATNITFNGVAATFTVVSATEITTSVPSGATTGKVQVVTPTVTLSSNIAFVVP